jgi:hypothetical protein
LQQITRVLARVSAQLRLDLMWRIVSHLSPHDRSHLPVRLLQQSIEQNRLEERTTCMPLAVSDVCALELLLELSAQYFGSLLESPDLVKYGSAAQGHPIFSLPDLLRRLVATDGSNDVLLLPRGSRDECVVSHLRVALSAR